MFHVRALSLLGWMTVLLLNAPSHAAEVAMPSARPATPLEFNRDIRPILSENCFFCHGQDPAHREADLRLDTLKEATRDLGGYAAIVPGKPEASDIIKRLTSHDRSEVMPPPKSNRLVTPTQIDLIKRWIAEGASYQKHWAFESPRKPELPAVKQSDWAKADVDRFVLARLEAEGLSPSREATPQKWLRRASLDLTGLPPTLAELNDFEADVKARGEAAYGAAADRLLASERFGERQAIDWLDAARYADTHGFNNDSTRTMWRWRDWVIEAFNTNKPYNQFITEQLAGDLLPNATLDQRLATGFGRNHVINSEGGIIDEEYRVEYVADRVRTTSMAWLGLTMECSRCHDHKFDPITQKDYYQFFAFFNNVAEHGEDGRVANAVPMMPAPTKPQAKLLAKQTAELADLDAKLQAKRDAWRWESQTRDQVTAAIGVKGEVAESPAKDAPFTMDAESAKPKAKSWSFPDGAPALTPGIRGQAWQINGKAAAAKLEPIAFSPNAKTGATVAFWFKADGEQAPDVPIISNLNHVGSPADAQYGKGYELRLINGELEFRASNRFPVYAVRMRSEGAKLTAGQWRHIAVVFGPDPDPTVELVPASTIRLFVDGNELATRVLNDGLSGLPQVQPWLLGADNSKDGAKFHGAVDEWRAYPRTLKPAEIQTLFAADMLAYAVPRANDKSATPTELAWLRDATGTNGDNIASRRNQVWEEHLALRRQLPSAMVMAEVSQPRPAHLLLRGAYDALGDRVEPGVPETLLVPWPENAPRNRLGLAQWFTRPDHPLTARVVVNRWWAQLFGTGLVKTLEDFGFQGEWPSHPELLDWLARDFVDNGWNVKSTFRTLVLSATYRQDSAVSRSLLERDPENRLLARGPRVRLPAEVVRDQALAMSGLLKNRIGGPSVFPYQPADLYKGVVVGTRYPGTNWVQSTGDDLYRRSLYTFWKRTVPHPAMLTFDAPDREFCSVRRSRTNTPLQALTLMNETGLVEAARELGGRMLKEGGDSDASRAAFGFRIATGRSPREDEAAVLVKTWEQFRKEFDADTAAAEKMLQVGASKPDGTQKPAELAAASVVASMILNLDETITKD